MNTSPDSNEDDMPDASELLDFELIAKSPSEKGRGLWLWVVLVLVFAGGGWAGWMFLHDQGVSTANIGEVPLILSPKFALKEKPSDPGGMKIPDRDKRVYDRMNGGAGVSSKPAVEHLLPPPEMPIEPPKASVMAPVPVAVPPVVVAPVPLKAVAPKPAPNPKPAPVQKAKVPAGQGYLVQLSAVRTEQAARGEWARLVKKNADVLGGLKPVIQRVDLGQKGIFYRVRGGWFASRALAKAVCSELARRNVGCLIVKP